jgi:hypothetical protein
MWQRRDWLRCSWTWPKDKTNSTCYISQSSIILLSQFCFRGDDFRRDYAQLSMSCAVFPNVPVVIATNTTANKLDRRHIKESLGLHNCFELVANFDRKNQSFTKRHSDIGKILMPCRTYADQFML